MPEPDRSTDGTPGADLRARIEARVAARRRDDPSAAARAHTVHARPGYAGPGRWRSVLTVLVTLAVILGLRTFVVASYYIPSGSMEPTLHGCPGCEPDMVMVDKFAYRFGSVARSDVLVFDRPPLAPAEDDKLIKRVVGLPGETLSAHDGTVYIGKQALTEPYLNPACNGTADFGPVVVAPDHYFMLGDNRCDSFDSRRFGAIGRSAIVGRAFAVVWPAKHLRWL